MLEKLSERSKGCEAGSRTSAGAPLAEGSPLMRTAIWQGGLWDGKGGVFRREA